jgi:hypothetical protein
VAAVALRNDTRTLALHAKRAGNAERPRFSSTQCVLPCADGRNFLNDLGADVLALWPDFVDYEIGAYCCARSRITCKNALF